LNKQEATEFVLRALADGKSHSEIADELSEELDAPYLVAERFVSKIEINSQRTIPRRKKLPALIFGILLVSCGVLMVVVGFLSIIPLLTLIAHMQVEFHSPILIPVDLALGFFFAGMGMVLGGSVGIYFGIQD
jgi:uncharacterized membrane protein